MRILVKAAQVSLFGPRGRTPGPPRAEGQPTAPSPPPDPNSWPQLASELRARGYSVVPTVVAPSVLDAGTYMRTWREKRYAARAPGDQSRPWTESEEKGELEAVEGILRRAGPQIDVPGIGPVSEALLRGWGVMSPSGERFQLRRFAFHRKKDEERLPPVETLVRRFPKALPKVLDQNGEWRTGNTVQMTDSKGKRAVGERIDGSFKETVPCDDRCVFATGQKCECSCGGANHGMGAQVSWIARSPTKRDQVTPADSWAR